MSAPVTLVRPDDLPHRPLRGAAGSKMLRAETLARFAAKHGEGWEDIVARSKRWTCGRVSEAFARRIVWEVRG